jgi:hypothetical protein
MQKADYLLRLMKQQTDALVATDEKLQQLLTWVSKKSSSVAVPYKPVAVRAFYFARVRAHVLNLPRADSSDFGRVLTVLLPLCLTLSLTVSLIVPLLLPLVVPTTLPISLIISLLSLLLPLAVPDHLLIP